jgi:hypothetical protein
MYLALSVLEAAVVAVIAFIVAGGEAVCLSWRMGFLEVASNNDTGAELRVDGSGRWRALEKERGGSS